jgi:probable rRNA maturation factor
MSKRTAKPASKRSTRRGAMTPQPTIAVLVRTGGWRRRLPRIAALCRRVAAAALDAVPQAPRGAELSIVLMNDAGMRRLNRDFRGHDRATNVLSFAVRDTAPAAAIAGMPTELGDVVLAYETVASEARAQGKSLADHAAHLVVHGVLHLLGYDHERKRQADLMETLERDVLAGLGIADPYQLGARA